jgi:NADH-quinone oxidoreductase subunit M
VTSVLSWVTFLPLVGALVILLLPRRAEGLVKVTAFVASLATFLLSVPLYTGFKAAIPDYQFVE